MSILVPLNGQNYVIPEPNETGWGRNLDNFFVAISNGVLQATGGSFTLSADTDFGPSFGLKSLYYKSRATNPSSTGQIRLGNAETLSWRNAANGGNLPLTADASDKLAFNGTVLVYAAGTGLSKSNEALSLSVPVVVANGGTGNTTLAAYSVLCGGTTTTGAVQSVSGVGASGQVLTSNGASTLPTWQNVAGSGTVNSGTANQLAYYASSTNVVSGLTAITASRALASDASGLPVASATTATELGYVNGVTSAIQTQLNLLAPKASPTFTGVVTLPTPFTLGATSVTATGAEMNCLVGVTSAIQTQLDAKAPLASPTFTGTVTAPTADITTISHTGGTAIRGSNTNDAAAAGFVGEVIQASVTGSPVTAAASGSWTDLTSISLTAGTWLVTCAVMGNPSSSTTVTSLDAGISTTSGNSSTGLTFGDNWFRANWTKAEGNSTCIVPSFLVALSSTTTYYAKMNAAYTGTAPSMQGRLTAVRIR